MSARKAGGGGRKALVTELVGSLVATILAAAVVIGFGVEVRSERGDVGGIFDDGVLSYRSMDVDAQIEENGNLTIAETLDVYLPERGEDDDGNEIPWRQLYQTYELQSDGITGICDISVENLTTGEQYSQIAPKSPSEVGSAEWDERYANHWYIADVTDGSDDPQPFDTETDGVVPTQDRVDSQTVEIGWNIPATVSADSMRFKITMTWEDAVTEYSDVAKMQWEPISNMNMVPIGTLSGTVRFPKAVTTKNSWAWLHFDGQSTTSRGPDGELKFTATDVPTGTWVDVVAMYNRDLCDGVVRQVDQDVKQATIDDETRQETEWRDKQRDSARRTVIAWIVIGVVGAAAAVAAMLWGFRSRKRAKYQGDLEYWREPLDMSPAASAEFLAFLDPKAAKSPVVDRQMASTLLSLVDKGAVLVLPGRASLYAGTDVSTAPAPQLAAIGQQAVAEGDGKAVRATNTLVILPAALQDPESLALSSSEQALLDLLVAVSDRVGSPVFDFKRMRKSLKDWRGGERYMSRFKVAALDEFKALHAVKSNRIGWAIFGGVGIAASFIGAMWLTTTSAWALTLVMSLPEFFCCVFGLSYGRARRLSVPRGQELAGHVLGLRNYMRDFSDFTDRGPLDLPRWGRYLVYATAFGMSKRALEQLATAYPQVVDGAWLDDEWDTAGALLVYWSLRPSTYYHSTVPIGAPERRGGPGGPVAPGGGEGPTVPGMATTGGVHASNFGGFEGFGAGFSDLGSQLSGSFSAIQSTIHAASPSSGGSGGSFSGGGFGGSGGGVGGGSFGGR